MPVDSGISLAITTSTECVIFFSYIYNRTLNTKGVVDYNAIAERLAVELSLGIRYVAAGIRTANLPLVR